jgi:hypothetical protein
MENFHTLSEVILRFAIPFLVACILAVQPDITSKSMV